MAAMKICLHGQRAAGKAQSLAMASRLPTHTNTWFAARKDHCNQVPVKKRDGEKQGGCAGEAKTEARVGVKVAYTIHLDGRVQMDWDVDAREALPAHLPPGLFKYIHASPLAHSCPAQLPLDCLPVHGGCEDALAFCESQ